MAGSRAPWLTGVAVETAMEAQARVGRVLKLVDEMLADKTVTLDEAQAMRRELVRALDGAREATDVAETTHLRMGAVLTLLTPTPLNAWTRKQARQHGVDLGPVEDVLDNITMFPGTQPQDAA